MEIVNNLYSNIPERKNGTEDVEASWFNLLRSAGLGAESLVRADLTVSDFSTAALTKQVTLFSLPLKNELPQVYIKHSVAASGGAISAYTLSVGLAGESTKYTAVPFDVFQGVGGTVFYFENFTEGVEDFSTGVNIIAEAVAIGANLDQATLGTFQIWARVRGLT